VTLDRTPEQEDSSGNSSSSESPRLSSVVMKRFLHTRLQEGDLEKQRGESKATSTVGEEVVVVSGSSASENEDHNGSRMAQEHAVEDIEACLRNLPVIEGRLVAQRNTC
jgi:hypothetical protein